MSTVGGRESQVTRIRYVAPKKYLALSSEVSGAGGGSRTLVPSLEGWCLSH